MTGESMLTPVTWTIPSAPGVPTVGSVLPLETGAGVGIMTLLQAVRNSVKDRIPRKRLIAMISIGYRFFGVYSSFMAYS
jgi:hypothetical protein